jgi:hypothetical protein
MIKSCHMVEKDTFCYIEQCCLAIVLAQFDQSQSHATTLAYQEYLISVKWVSARCCWILLPMLCEYVGDATMLVCDQYSKGGHIRCLTPPWLKVPDGGWLCFPCITWVSFNKCGWI